MNKLPIIIPVITSWFIWHMFPHMGPLILGISWILPLIHKDHDDYSASVFTLQFATVLPWSLLMFAATDPSVINL